MGKITTDKLPDMQKTQEGLYRKGIEKVGVSGISILLPIKMKDGSVQKTIATVSSFCNLDADTKGINMSRINRTINSVLAEHSSQDEVENLVDTTLLTSFTEYQHSDKSEHNIVKKFIPFDSTLD